MNRRRPWGVAVFARPDAAPVGLILGVVGLVAVAAVSLVGLERLPLPLCFFKLATGLPCLACGTTRALARLAAVDVPGALAFNPLATVAALAVGPWAAADFVLATRGRALAVEMGTRAAAATRVLAVSALVANWVYLLAAGR